MENEFKIKDEFKITEELTKDLPIDNGQSHSETEQLPKSQRHKIVSEKEKSLEEIKLLRESAKRKKETPVKEELFSFGT